MFTGKEGEIIPLDKASKWTANYRAKNPNKINAHFFGEHFLREILVQKNCVGLRMYYAMDEKGIQQLLVVGADANGNDLYNGIILDRAIPCPPICGGGGSPLIRSTSNKLGPHGFKPISGGLLDV